MNDAADPAGAWAYVPLARALEELRGDGSPFASEIVNRTARDMLLSGRYRMLVRAGVVFVGTPEECAAKVAGGI